MKLKPCPKCGGRIVGLQSAAMLPRRWRAICMRCGFSGPLKDRQVQAAEAWNGLIDKVQDSETGD